jgi:succinoglycan biosynthesis transport protein ExoP
MNHPEPSTANPGTIITTLTRRWYLWIVPTVLATLAALAYAKWHEPQWRASQALLVRDEAGSETDRQGRFVNIEAMQTFQETIHEVARNHAVVDSTLCELGPPSEYKQPNIWPTDRDIEDAQDAVRVEAPGGAEFGRTEVIHLSVTVAGRERALAFCQALCDKLDERMRRLRNDKAQGMIAELDRSAEMAQNNLAAATVRLQSLERKVGSDLGELRVLSEVGAGESNLRSSLNQLEAELRDANATLRSRQQQKKLLQESKDNPLRLLATPSHLLDTQSALRRLKEGLVDAQLRTAELASTLNQDHPRMRAARNAEDGIRREMHAELDLALKALAADLEVSEDRVASLERQLDGVRGRLDQLADLRAEYGNLVSEVRQRTNLVEKARADLTEAQASRSAAETASLLTRIDAPRVGDNPVGPSRKMIVLGGFAGGLATGLGLVFLVTPLGVQVGRAGRRWTDRFMNSRSRRTADSRSTGGAGRRESDLADQPVVVGRREEDRTATNRARNTADRATPDNSSRSQRASDTSTARRSGDQSPSRRSKDGSMNDPAANPDRRRTSDAPAKRDSDRPTDPNPLRI